jgi:hypothetical protein
MCLPESKDFYRKRDVLSFRHSWLPRLTVPAGQDDFGFRIDGVYFVNAISPPEDDLVIIH